jgi:hypothetical protein
MKRRTLLALVVAITSVLAVHATANEWNLYGSVRMATFYTSEDLGDLYKSDTNPSGDDEFGRSTVKDLQWNLQSNSHIGARVKGNTVNGRFEFGTSSGNETIRLFYGEWQFSENWGLKVGQDYTPITFFLANQVFDTDNELENVGNAYGGWHGQVTVEGTLGPGTLKFAAITPETSTLNVTSGATTDKNIDFCAVTGSPERQFPILLRHARYPEASVRAGSHQ